MKKNHSVWVVQYKNSTSCSNVAQVLFLEGASQFFTTENWAWANTNPQAPFPWVFIDRKGSPKTAEAPQQILFIMCEAITTLPGLTYTHLVPFRSANTRAMGWGDNIILGPGSILYCSLSIPGWKAWWRLQGCFQQGATLWDLHIEMCCVEQTHVTRRVRNHVSSIHDISVCNAPPPFPTEYGPGILLT